MSSKDQEYIVSIKEDEILILPIILDPLRKLEVCVIALLTILCYVIQAWYDTLFLSCKGWMTQWQCSNFICIVNCTSATLFPYVSLAYVFFLLWAVLKCYRFLSFFISLNVKKKTLLIKEENLLVSRHKIIDLSLCRDLEITSYFHQRFFHISDIRFYPYGGTLSTLGPIQIPQKFIDALRDCIFHKEV